MHHIQKKSSGLGALTLATSLFITPCALAQDDHANTVGSRSTQILPSSSTTGILTRRDFDIFRVELPSAGRFTCETTGPTDTFGFLVRIANRRLVIIDRNDDSGAGRNFLISEDLPAGTHYVAVRGYSRRVTGPYTLETNFIPNEENLGVSDIRVTGLGGREIVNGDVTASEADGTDFGDVLLSDPSGQTLTLNIANQGTGVLNLEGISLSSLIEGQFSVDGDPASLNPGDRASYTISFNPTLAGPQEATATITSSDPEDGNFSFVVAGVGTVPEIEDDHGNSANTASPLNGSANGRLEVGGDIDAFSFTVRANSEIAINSSGNTDVFGSVTDSSGNLLGNNDNGGSNQNFRLSGTLPVGTYTLLVQGASPAITGNYQVSLTQAEIVDPPADTETDTDTDTTPSDSASSDAERVLTLVNELRTSRGLNPLSLNARLIEAARVHSQDMVSQGFFDHTGSDNSSAGQRITRAGYQWNTFGENIAQGQSSADRVHQAWVNSAPHLRNILNPNFVEMGLGRVNNTWTQVFGRAR